MIPEETKEKMIKVFHTTDKSISEISKMFGVHVNSTRAICGARREYKKRIYWDVEKLFFGTNKMSDVVEIKFGKLKSLSHTAKCMLYMDEFKHLREPIEEMVALASEPKRIINEMSIYEHKFMSA